MNNNKIYRKEFNMLDAAIACMSFIVLQYLMGCLTDAISGSISFGLYVFILFMGEFIFFIAAIIPSLTRKVNFFTATKLNKKIDILSVLLALGISIVCLFGFSGLTNVFVAFIEKLGYKTAIGTIEILNPLTYIFYVIFLAIFPAFFEDVLFRGVIQSGLEKQGKTKAVLLSALIFMLMHGLADQTVHQFLLGIILGYVYIASGSILIPVLIHFFNNFITVTAIYVQGASAESQILSWGDIGIQFAFAIISAVASSVLLFYMIKALKKLKDKRDAKEQIKDEIIQETTQEKTLTLSENIEKNNKEKTELLYGKIIIIASIVVLAATWILSFVKGFGLL